MKKFLLLLLSLIFIFGVFSACGAKDEYIIVTDDSFAPFCSADNKGNAIGFDIDLLNMIADEENIKLTVVPIGLAKSLDALESGDADAVIAALIPSEEFGDKFDFSDIYYYEYAFAVSKGKNAELLESFNSGLEKIKANGKYDELLEKYKPGIENE